MGVPDPDRDGKATLRARLRTQRREQAPHPGTAAHAERAHRVAALVLAQPEVSRATAVGSPLAAYCSLPLEPPTDVLLERLRADGVPALLPEALPGGLLAWHRDGGPASRRPGILGIPIPSGTPMGTGVGPLLDAGVRVVVVPALAVDADGGRLGQGGGYYDRLLASLPPFRDGGPLRLGLVGPGEVLAAGALPTDAHDQRLDRWVVA